MKRFLITLLFCISFTTTSYAQEHIFIGEHEAPHCNDIEYLEAVDITIASACQNAVPHEDPPREFHYLKDAQVPAITQDWPFQYHLQQPSYPQLATVTLAIIDTGFSSTNPWLSKYITSTYNVETNTTDIPDIRGREHGTLVATAAMIAMHEAPTNLMLIKADRNGALPTSNIVRGINYAIENGADIINLSLGGPGKQTAEQHAIEQALAAGITIVAAAGNGGDGRNRIEYPAGYDGVISVGAVTEQLQRASFSTYNDRVSVVAPGTNMLLIRNDYLTRYANGTSFAAPFVAGTLAMMQQYTQLSPVLLKEAIEVTARDLHTKGYDNETGYGFIQGKEALQYIRSVTRDIIHVTSNTVHVTFSQSLKTLPHNTVTLYNGIKKSTYL